MFPGAALFLAAYASALNPASPSILKMPSFLPAFQKEKKKSLSKHCCVKLPTRTISTQTHLHALPLVEYSLLSFTPTASQGQPLPSVCQASPGTVQLQGAALPAADTASRTELSPGRLAHVQLAGEQDRSRALCAGKCMLSSSSSQRCTLRHPIVLREAAPGFIKGSDVQ